MYKLTTLKNGLTLITVDLPHLDSVTTLVAVGAGSRYETKKNNGISHFLEHMFFKGSRKYPTTEIIATLVDGIGAINNAATDKEITYYWIKSAAKHLDIASDVVSSMLKESLFAEEEIEREKGVIVEELRMYRDNPAAYVWNLYEHLQFGNQPLGFDVGGSEKVIKSCSREDFLEYMSSLYAPKNMTLVYVGKLPKNIQGIAEKHFSNLPDNSQQPFLPYQPVEQNKPRVSVFYKKTDQANLVMGVKAFDRYDPQRYAARLLSMILGEGMSSRLFIQIRERRGLAYHVASVNNPYKDAGFFAVYGGLKLEKIDEALEVIKEELHRLTSEKVAENELKKVKDMERGRLALRTESSNFLAEYFGIKFILDRKLETFEQYLKNIDQVTAADIQNVAKQLFKPQRYNLQMIGPFKDASHFEERLSS